MKKIIPILFFSLLVGAGAVKAQSALVVNVAPLAESAQIVLPASAGSKLVVSQVIASSSVYSINSPLGGFSVSVGFAKSCTVFPQLTIIATSLTTGASQTFYVNIYRESTGGGGGDKPIPGDIN